MNTQSLSAIARALVVDGKGILAADESTATIGKRFAQIGVENIEANRRAYRELLFTAPEMEKYISGVIMYDETLRQSTQTGVSFVKLLVEKGIIPGIKVDEGTEPLPSDSVEVVTRGLDGLGQRLKEYYELGARFAKWRAVIKIQGESIPTYECLQKNAVNLAKYARLCQDNNIVPVVEPEVLMDGDHTIERCLEVTSQLLKIVFTELGQENIDLAGMLLKPNMVISSLTGPKVDAKQVAENTLKCFNSFVPPTVPGIVFLSGGQSEEEACQNLNTINSLAKNVPWKLSFSYGRALQNSALKTWGGKEVNFTAAQKVFAERAKAASLAAQGKLK